MADTAAWADRFERKDNAIDWAGLLAHAVAHHGEDSPALDHIDLGTKHAHFHRWKCIAANAAFIACVLLTVVVCLVTGHGLVYAENDILLIAQGLLLIAAPVTPIITMQLLSDASHNVHLALVPSEITYDVQRDGDTLQITRTGPAPTEDDPGRSADETVTLELTGDETTKQMVIDGAKGTCRKLRNNSIRRRRSELDAVGVSVPPYLSMARGVADEYCYPDGRCGPLYEYEVD